MAEDRSPEEAPRFRPYEGVPFGERFRAPDRYGLLIIMILSSILISAWLSDTTWGPVLGAALMGMTLLYAMKTSRVRYGLRRLAYVLVPVLVVSVGVAAVAVQNRLTQGLVAGLYGMLVLAAIGSIASRVRLYTTIEMRTVLAALSIYLLLGLFYSAVFPMFEAIAGTTFFAQPNVHGSINFIYYSYITIATVGYGDLTPAGNLPKMIAVSEALIGQLFLVTVVALTVSNLGKSTRRAEADAKGDD